MHEPNSAPKALSLADATAWAPASNEELREYLVHLDGLNLSEAQKLELLQSVWSIMSALVDLTFGVDSVQQALAASKRESTSDALAPTDAP